MFGEGGAGGGFMPSGGNVADVGVGDRFGARGARLSLRLLDTIKSDQTEKDREQSMDDDGPKSVEERH